jgi:hypothetical protein
LVAVRQILSFPRTRQKYSSSKRKSEGSGGPGEDLNTGLLIAEHSSSYYTWGLEGGQVREHRWFQPASGYPAPAQSGTDLWGEELRGFCPAREKLTIGLLDSTRTLLLKLKKLTAIFKKYCSVAMATEGLRII